MKKNQLVYILMMMILMTTTTCMFMMWQGTHVSQHMCGSQRTTFGSCFSPSTIKGFKWTDSDLRTSWQALLHTKPWTPFCLTLGSVPLTSVPSTCKAMMLQVSSPNAESGSSRTLLCWWIRLMLLPLPSSHVDNGKRTATSLDTGKNLTLKYCSIKPCFTEEVEQFWEMKHRAGGCTRHNFKAHYECQGASAIRSWCEDTARPKNSSREVSS